MSRPNVGAGSTNRRIMKALWVLLFERKTVTAAQMAKDVGVSLRHARRMIMDWETLIPMQVDLIQQGKGIYYKFEVDPEWRKRHGF